MDTLKQFVAVLFIAGVTIWTMASPASKPARNFHPYTIAQITAEDPVAWKHPLTHLEVEGWVTYKSHEDDGDWHIRICDALTVTTMDVRRCIVAEIIPELPRGPIPRVGEHVRVQGIYRWDAESPGHHWAEVHPVTKIEEVTVERP